MNKDEKILVLGGKHKGRFGRVCGIVSGVGGGEYWVQLDGTDHLIVLNTTDFMTMNTPFEPKTWAEAYRRDV